MFNESPLGAEKQIKKLKNLLQYNKPLKLTAFHLTILEDGLTLAESILYALQPTLDYSLYPILKRFSESLNLNLMNRLYHKQLKSFIVECPQINKEMILNDNLNISETNIQPTLLYLILVLALIITEKASKKFWNSQCQINSQKLWLPTKIDWQDLDLNSLNTSSNLMEQNSPSIIKIMKNQNQTQKNSLMTSCQSSMSSHVDKWVKEDIITKTRKIRIYPNNKQTKILNDWFSTYRYVYNKTLGYITDSTKEDPLSYEVNLEFLFEPYHYMNFQSMRNHFITTKNNIFIKDFEKNTPKDIRAGAIKDIISHFKTGFTQLKNGSISHFKLNFKRKKQINESLCLPKTSFEIKQSHISVYSTYFTKNSKIKLKTRTQKDIRKLFNSQIDIKDSLLHRDKQNRYYILLVYEKNNDKIVEPKNNMCSLDPGCKSMFTGYSPDIIFKIESHESLRKKLFDKIRHFQSLRGKNLIKKSKLLSKILQIHNKIKNIVSDIHWKTINFLRKTFCCILLPSFESQKIVATNTIKSVKRNILSLRHYDFKQKLKQKIKETKNSPLGADNSRC